MKKVMVLGTGCANCKTTLRVIGETAKALDVEVELEKVEDMQAIVEYGVISTPGVVVDDKVVHSGGLPARSAIESWLLDSAHETCCSSTSQSRGCCR